MTLFLDLIDSPACGLASATFGIRGHSTEGGNMLDGQTLWHERGALYHDEAAVLAGVSPILLASSTIGAPVCTEKLLIRHFVCLVR